MTEKLAALDYLQYHSVENTAKTFKVDSKQIRNWRNSEAEIRSIASAGGKQCKRRRLDGGGRKVGNLILEEKLKEWILSRREQRLRVSRKSIQREALRLATELKENFEGSPCTFVASVGWLEKFLRRNGFSLRARTTISSKTPSDCTERVVNFIVYLRKVILQRKFSHDSIYVMVETPVWLEPVGKTTIATKGAKDVPIMSTGHEKLRLTVVLTARADGTKCKPYVLIPRRRPIPELESMRGVVFNYSGQSWMNDELTADYLRNVVGRFSFGKRLMIWDSFRCHVSPATKTALRKFNIHAAVIPGGCTGLIQAPDVSWNRSFKASIQKSYEDWLSGNEHTFTKSGNLKAPKFAEFALWIDEAWTKLPAEQIRNSMKQCGITNASDGSEDHLIECFKPGNLYCGGQIDLLKSRLESDFVDIPEDFPVSDSDDELESACDSDESN